MNTQDVHRYRMLVRVREFGAAHRDLFPAAGPAGQLFAAVSKAVDQLGTHVGTQAAGRGASREGAMSKAAARGSLAQALDAIARTARVLDHPGLSGKFRVPRARNDHELATAAVNFLKSAEPLEAQFVAHGLPKSFLTDLRATLDAFERAAQDRLAALETNAAAAAGIATAMEVALTALSRLDAIVANTLRDEPTLFAAWATARRVPRVRTGVDSQPAPGGPAKTPETGQAA